MAFVLLNIFCLTVYIYNFDLPNTSFLLKILYFIVFLLSICFFIYKKKKILITKLNLSFFSIILTLIFLEFFFYLKPNLLPDNISIWTGDRKEKNKLRETELLNENPFVKFKANTKIKMQYFKGNTNQFEYEWLTDKNGFKNTLEIANLEKYKIVAIGDSFTEGYGVSIEDTFTSILTEKGYPSYSVGVQGYAITQSKGALKKFGLKLNPEIIFCLYLRGTSYRENFFINDELQEKGKFTGGINNQFRLDQSPEIRNQAKYVVSALWLYSKFLRNNFSTLTFSNDFKNDFFNLYPEISFASEISELNIQEMNLLIKKFEEIKKIADKNNSKFLLGYIEGRTINYYERATSKKPHPSQFNERDFLKKFSEENNIKFIDFGGTIRNYVNNLPEDFKISDLPYLEVDGHLSKTGNEIIADTIIKNIKKN